MEHLPGHIPRPANTQDSRVQVLHPDIRALGRWVILGSNCCMGYEDGDLYDYRAIGGYHPFSEILGMDITIEYDIVITPQELAAGLFWEITYYGQKP